MLSALLLGGLFSAPISTLALFLIRGQSSRGDGAMVRLGRFLTTTLATLVLAAVTALILFAIGVTRTNLEAAAVGLVIVSLAWMPVTRNWNALAHLCWAATTYLFLAYLVFMLWWTFVSHLGAGGTIGGMILLLLELFAALLGCAYLWELCDTLGRARWVRRIGERELDEVDSERRPFVCMQVPCYNEPPDMVIATLVSLQAMDYPNFETVVLDDNTDDEALWRPVEAWCDEHGVKFAHLSDWPGYKSGALNYALREMIDERAEVIGVVDSDYQIDPSFLARCAPLFADDHVGFIQAPQDYRDWEGAAFYRRLYYSYKYFFAVSQPSRNERDAAIFAGTMGLIRRSALEQAGGWDEWCITEDAELSLRLLRDGWTGLHVDPSFGRGIMPLTFEALKGQRFRWCFGGIQILRRHWRWMLPGRRTEENRLNAGQRWAYFSGAIQWYGDLLAIIFYAFLLVGAANIAFSGGLLFRKLTGFLLAAIPVLVLLGLLRAVALLRRGTGATWRDAIGAFLIWQSTSLTVARASVQALFAKEAAFLRTPKTAEEGHLRDAIRGNWVECLLGVLGVAAIAGALARSSGYGGMLIAALLLWPTLSFFGAPINSLSAQRAALPPELAERRRTEHRRAGARRVTYAVGSLGLAGLASAAAFAVLAPGPANIVPPQLVGPASGHPAHYGPARASAAKSPATQHHGAVTTTLPSGASGRSTTTTLAGNSGALGNSGATGLSSTTTTAPTSTTTAPTTTSALASTTTTTRATTTTIARATTTTTPTTTTTTTTTTTIP
ncbi:MAG TPA: glycosyltransferase [Acidimicrobiales bacterium]|nr:glycosyltransferase [Acidimicrobiales bacterium]